MEQFDKAGAHRDQAQEEWQSCPQEGKYEYLGMTDWGVQRLATVLPPPTLFS